MPLSILRAELRRADQVNTMRAYPIVAAILVSLPVVNLFGGQRAERRVFGRRAIRVVRKIDDDVRAAMFDYAFEQRPCNRARIVAPAVEVYIQAVVVICARIRFFSVANPHLKRGRELKRRPAEIRADPASVGRVVGGGQTVFSIVVIDANGLDGAGAQITILVQFERATAPVEIGVGFKRTEWTGGTFAHDGVIERIGLF